MAINFRRSLPFAGAILALSILGLADSALAGKKEVARKAISYKTTYTIDCHDPRVDHADTSNTVTVKFWNNKTLLGTKSAVPSCGNWLKGHANYSISGHQPVTHVTAAINGSNAFYIDQAWLKHEQTDKVTYEKYVANADGGTSLVYENKTEESSRTLAHWGRNAGLGYCLSTDPNDAGGSWTPYVGSGGCTTSASFYDGSYLASKQDTVKARVSTKPDTNLWQICGTKKCKPCTLKNCTDVTNKGLDRDKDKADLKACSTGYRTSFYRKYDLTWPAADVWLKICAKQKA